MGMGKSKNNGSRSKKPDNIVWIEEVILNYLINEYSSTSGKNIESVPNASTPTSKSSIQGSRDSRSTHDHSVSSIIAERGSTVQQSEHSMWLSTTRQASQSELQIGIAEIELKDESYLGDDRVRTLSRIVTGKIKYFIGSNDKQDDEERYQYWIIKMPNLMNPNRNLSQEMDVAKREISFYTEILPCMRTFLETYSLSHLIELKVPTCYYGKYVRPMDAEPELDIITHILDSESLLVLDDLRSYGFGKRHFGSGLVISEAVSAMEQIVKFHVTSWAMENKLFRESTPKWPHLYDWKEVAHLYYNLLEGQFPLLQKFIYHTGHPKAHEVYTNLVKIRPVLQNTLYSLLAPAQHPYPNTLIHLDLWSDNILFKISDQDKEDQVPLEEANLDCYILDWQMVSYGKPTHDLALLIMLSMDPSYRRQHVTWMLQFYYQLFEKTAGYFGLEIPFDFQTLKREYKLSCVLATLMAMASIEMVQIEETTQNRLMEALVDLLDEKLI